MINAKGIAKDIDAMKAMKEFISVYEEIAANNMRRIRDAVVRRRDFLAEVTKLYNEVKTSYKKEVEGLSKRRKNSKGTQFTLLKKNDKTVCVFFSTNASLYGDIVRNTYALFKDYLGRETSDVVIVGKVGKRVFEEDNPGVAYTYFDFPDMSMDQALLKPIVLHIARYEKVVIFYPKFQTLVNQTPTAFVISESKIDTTVSEAQTKYIFEPSLERIIEYFEKEIFSSIFEQTMHESQLSKFASRMVNLDAATENIKKRLFEFELKERLLQHQMINKQQLNSIARMVMWTRRR
jgi:F-type H+-transporting ATPase subunit gamma